MGYRVTVCDARPVFATPARFPDVDGVVVAGRTATSPSSSQQGLVDERTVICVLTHDPNSMCRCWRWPCGARPVAYIGAMGSRRTHNGRLARLRKAGLGEQELARLHSPVGLDLGSRTPEETAVSIAAEIIAAQWGGSGEPLGLLSDRIHHDELHEPTDLP